jgi:hypothetical protein
MSVLEIGCCGAYCKPCKVYQSGACRGCKAGYGSGGRDLLKAKCAVKVCCLQKGFQSCADCADAPVCETLQAFYQKNGYKYQKYRQATAFIRECGYDAFLAIADRWNGAYGRYE